MKKNLIQIILLVVSSAYCFSQEVDKSQLDNYLNNLETHNKFMGSIAVSRDGEWIYTKSIGSADVENKTMASEKSKYRIGSISKTFTAVLVLKAVEENKIELSEPLSNYFPTIENAATITIDQLLYHRSGIHSVTDDEDYLEWNTQPISEQELIDKMIAGRSKFEPDSKFEYSNSNYILLSFILQNVYDKTYSELLEEKITTPLGLKDTYYGAKIDPTNDECYSYSFSSKWEKESETDMSVPMGAGAVVSTATDLNQFAQALFLGKIISKESLEQMTSLKDNFGRGVFPIPFYENEGFGHTGAIDGFTSMFVYFPETNVCLTLLSNGTNYNNNEIARAVLSVVYNVSYDFPEFKSYEVTEADLQKYLGTYATTDLPLKLMITNDGNSLVAQATGQQALYLDATDKDTFTFDRAGVVIVFDPEKNALLLKQGGGEFNFVKE